LAALVDSFVIGNSEEESGEAIAGHEVAHLFVGVGVKGSSRNISDFFCHFSFGRFR